VVRGNSICYGCAAYGKFRFLRSPSETRSWSDKLTMNGAACNHTSFDQLRRTDDGNNVQDAILVLEHNSEEGTMHVQGAIPTRPADVINEPQLAELIYKETDARPDADHLGQRFRLALLPKVGQQQQRPRQPLLAGIKHWNVCRSTSFSTINQVVSKRFVKNKRCSGRPSCFRLELRYSMATSMLHSVSGIRRSDRQPHAPPGL